jgi:hypothetical protein
VLKLHPVVLLEALCGGQSVAAAFSDERRGRSNRLFDRISISPHFDDSVLPAHGKILAPAAIRHFFLIN